MADCGALDFACSAGEAAAGFLGDLAKGATEGVGKAIGGLGTLWVRVDVPELTDKAAPSAVSPGERGSGTEGIVTVLGYVSWVGAALAVGSLLVLAVLFAVRRDQGMAITDRIVLVLGGLFVISGGTAIVAALVPQGPTGVGGAVHFLQASTWWYTLAGALLGVLIGGVRMIVEQRARAGRDLVQSLVTLVLVAAAGVTVVNLLVTAADGFATWILDRSLDCELDTSGACFGLTMTKLIVVSGVGSVTSGGFGSVLVIILALLALVVVIIQILMMIMRGALLVALAGVLPLSASATNTQRGKAWFEKVIGWILAFILYKPAAAIVYATAFRLTGTAPSDDGNAIVTALGGIMLLVLALIALPALMRTIVPAVSAVAGATGGGAAGGALAAAAMSSPTGAVDMARRGLDAVKGSFGGGGESEAGGQGAAPSGSSPSGGGGPAAGGASSDGPAGSGAAGREAETRAESGAETGESIPKGSTDSPSAAAAGAPGGSSGPTSAGAAGDTTSSASPGTTSGAPKSGPDGAAPRGGSSSDAPPQRPAAAEGAGASPGGTPLRAAIDGESTSPPGARPGASSEASTPADPAASGSSRVRDAGRAVRGADHIRAAADEVAPSTPDDKEERPGP